MRRMCRIDILTKTNCSATFVSFGRDELVGVTTHIHLRFPS